MQHASTHGVDPSATIRLVLVGPSAGDVPAMSGALVFGASKCLPLEFAELSAVGALRVSVPRETVQQAAREIGLEVSECRMLILSVWIEHSLLLIYPSCGMCLHFARSPNLNQKK